MVKYERIGGEMGIKILDCTLRDGGYINSWEFSKNDIESISKNLEKSKIDFVELGYLSETQKKRGTIFNEINQLKEIKIENSKKIIMINFGEVNEKNILENTDQIFGIRIVFKKEQWKEALEYSKILIKKGYNIFIQPMQTISYSDKEILELIEETNKINPYSIYIVDSFGEMKKEDLRRIVALYANNLKDSICIGFHSHNNLQLSFALAIEFCEIYTEQEKIIDSSVYGMGRGAGNLNTELFMEYLNDKYKKKYELKYILKIMDLNLDKIYQKEKWGYNLGHFLSAKIGCHPNYASYLLEKRTLGIESIKTILGKISVESKGIYNKSIIEELYENFQHENNKYRVISFEKIPIKEKVLLIAPGKSVLQELNKIKKFSKTEDVTTICLNHKNLYIKSTYLFFGNEKRYQEFNNNFKKNDQIIATSNIKNIEFIDYIIDYNKLSKNKEKNFSSVLLLNFISNLENVKTIYLAGFDGYQASSENYFYETQEVENIEEVNSENKIIISKMKNFNKNIVFITESIYNLEEK